MNTKSSLLLSVLHEKEHRTFTLTPFPSTSKSNAEIFMLLFSVVPGKGGVTLCGLYWTEDIGISKKVIICNADVWKKKTYLTYCLTCFYLNLGYELRLANKKSHISGTILSNKRKVSHRIQLWYVDILCSGFGSLQSLISLSTGLMTTQ